MTIDPQNGASHTHSTAEWAELFARTVAHLAAQLTMAQLRLTALASELEARGAVEPAAVQARLTGLARRNAGAYLRENLGPDLADAIDVESLEGEIIAFLADEG